MSRYIIKDKKYRLKVRDFEMKRIKFQSIIQDLSISPYLRGIVQSKLHLLPGSKTKIKNRCIITGRGRSVYRFCQLSRITFRELAGKGRLPGVIKASW